MATPSGHERSKPLLIANGVVKVLGLFAPAGINGRQAGGAAEAGMAGFVVCGSFPTQAFTWPLNLHPSLAVAIDRYVAANRTSSIADGLSSDDKSPGSAPA